MRQQGDVNIWTVPALPDGARKIEGEDAGVVRLGEATGHMHRIVGEDVTIYAIGPEDGAQAALRHGERMFAMVGDGGAELVHEEHGTQTLAPGIHEFSPVHEFDPFEERTGYVFD